MATQPPVFEEKSVPETKTTSNGSAASGDQQPKASRPSFRQVLRELDWRLLLIWGVGLGAVWVVLLSSNATLMLLASLLPVLAGFVVGRRIQRHPAWHGIMLSLISTVVALTTSLILLLVVGPTPLLVQLPALTIMSLLPFPALGVIVSSRSEQRARAAREQFKQRGGKLDRPGRVRSVDDVQALSLPQLGGYVADLFRKHGFAINDYRIEKEKDRIDFKVTHEDTPWLLRVTTAEKVKPGVVQELAQRMKAEGITKGVVITSMDFQDPAVRWAKNKPVALIDGETLLSMDD